MSQTKVHTINIKNDFQNGFLNTSKIGRPNTRDNNPRSETFVFRNNHIVATKKVKPQKPIPEPNIPPNTLILGQTFHPKLQALLRDAPLDSHGKDDTTPSQGRDPKFFRDSHLTPEEVEYENRENKFRTLNARGQNRPDLSFLEAGNQNKMSTLQPDELNVNALRARIVEQIRRNKSRHEERGRTLDVSILPELSKKKSHNDSAFPQILAPKTINEKISQIENIYTLTPPKRSSKANIREETTRAKSNQRGSHIIKEKLEMERRAISQIRMAEHPNEMKLLTPPKPIQTRILKPKIGTENKLDHSGLQLNPSQSKNSSAIFILESADKQASPHPPATDQPERKARAKSNVRPRLKEIKSKSPLKILDRLNASDFIYQEYETNYYFVGSAGPSTRGQVLIEGFPKPSEADFTSHQTEERSSFKGIIHHKTQPQLEDRDHDKNQNNKSVDTQLRQTVDSQHDISYVEKENPKSFVISPPFERKGKFTRKANNTAIKRDDSNKNILDEFADKSIKISTEEQHITRDRSVSKSPFDEIMETSLMSYEKDSMIQSRTNKEIDSLLSIKHPHFKRSKVIVSKGHHGSAEKDGSHNTSTNISNSKSTNKYESMQGKGKEDFFAPSATSIKNENMEIDFGFEDDLTMRQKTDKSPTLKDSKKPVLNVITEEMNQQKETIRASMSDNCIIESEEYDKSEGEANRTPSSKMSSVKPLYFYTAGKLNKNPSAMKNEKEKQSTFSQKLQEDDDICVNGACLDNDEEYTKTIENNVENSLTNI